MFAVLADEACVCGQTSNQSPPALLLAWIAAVFIAACSAQAQVEVLPDRPAPSVFGAGARPVTFRLRNAATQTVEVNLRHQLFQASASTLAPLGEGKPWKSLALAPGQTTLETFEVELPAVRGETLFQIAWFDGNRKIGTTPVRVFPDGILKLLGPIAGDKPVGLVDPEGQLKPALDPLPTTELNEAEDILSAEVSLILVAPMPPKSRPAGLAAALKKKAARGPGIVWLQPPAPREPSDWTPPVFVVDEGAGHIVVANASLVADLSASPRAQQSLVRLAEIAAGRRKLELPADPSP